LIDGEIISSLDWRMGLYIPFQTLAKYCGAAAFRRCVWKGNFYKCADKSSHPHWGAWRAVEPLNFHQPKFFGALRFSTDA